MDTLARGRAAEAAVLHALLRAGVDVLIPFGGGLPFDLVAVSPRDGSFVRVQVKSGRTRRGCVYFNVCSTDHGSGRHTYRGKADVIAVHVTELDRQFVMPIDDCPSYVGVLRLDLPRNNQRRGVRLAESYSLEHWARSFADGLAHTGSPEVAE